jgi:hypothetical protein
LLDSRAGRRRYGFGEHSNFDRFGRRAARRARDEEKRDARMQQEGARQPDEPWRTRLNRRFEGLAALDFDFASRRHAAPSWLLALTPQN